MTSQRGTKGNTAQRTPYGLAPHLLARFAHSDEKIGGASAVLSLCGIA